ncbi:MULTISPECIES: FadR/GntR family transcriptional regulator [Microbacterium]|uniref:FadR/GntR family transcriptional regulator n=1 Tax=Microbacterium TaxID=33882 RepID=UPI002789A066|nr:MULTISPECIES: FadR/GntR family transcriptional regulator [Microbacterium]MDQ1085025.1 GntR family transcriptional repressor for pyruvate dehydrogenase complex [Microbacterium sp. SORGH_AS_0344]MDQ1169699.1 GntR family transcriptional repressor for pyruvate dehydrogenase complex [Microbacterium proteolyticum]
MTDGQALAPLQRGGGSLRDEIVARLRALIVTGVLKPGDRLATERDLAAQLAVSRSAVREALLRLESAGLIERRQGSGTRVSGRIPVSAVLATLEGDDDGTVAASAEFRTVVEPQIARLAASRIDEEQIAALAALLAESDQVRDIEHSVRLDVAFHVAIAAATRNPLLTSLSELTVSWTVEARVSSHLDEEGRRLSHDGHARLLRALRAGDPDGAEAAMRVHLDEIADLVARART